MQRVGMFQRTLATVFNKLSGLAKTFAGASDRLDIRGFYTNVLHTNKDGEEVGRYSFHNDITNEGKGQILDIMFHDATQIASTSWYIGLISNSGYSALAAGDTMASHSGWTEATGYTESTRVAWGPGASSSQTTTNASPATFDMNATATIKGIFVTSNSTKSGTSGKLWATGLFSADVPVNNGDQLKVTYSVSC